MIHLRFMGRFRTDDHVNVSWCWSQTNDSDATATSHVVACLISKLLHMFRQIVEFCFRENQHGILPQSKVAKHRQAVYKIIIQPLTCSFAVRQGNSN